MFAKGCQRRYYHFFSLVLWPSCPGRHLGAREVVLLRQDAVEGPEAQPADVAQLARAVEEFARVPSLGPHAPRHAAEQLHEERQVVLVPALCNRALCDKA